MGRLDANEKNTLEEDLKIIKGINERYESWVRGLPQVEDTRRTMPKFKSVLPLDGRD